MFFILSKLIHWLLSPLVWSVLLLVAALFLRSEKWKKRTLISALAILIFFTNPMIAKWAMNQWEPKAKSYEEITEVYDCAIVLAGITDPNRPPYDRIHFNKGADRVVHAVDLYKQGKVKKILISGGSGVLTFEGNKESHALADFVRMCGVDSTDVLIEDQSRNTHENALYSLSLLRGGNYLLFTSAFHMCRAESCFAALGADVDTFPTDYYGGPIRWNLEDLLVPQAHSLQLWSILLKEWVGILAYSFAGYL